MRVILDANVLIAAVAGRGLCEDLLELCLEEHRLIISEELLEELHRNLTKKLKVPEPVVVDFCRLLRNHAIMGVPSPVPKNACRDAKDHYLLGLSQSAKTEYLVTGDKDLIECGWKGMTKIVTPRQFWDKCRQIPGKED